ncbi:MAG: hypothetical protein WCO35_02720 [Candidatus Nomurabacteria bacterium]
MKDDLRSQLVGLGLTEDQIKILEAQGGEENEDMQYFTANDIVTHTKCGLVTAKKIVATFAPKAQETPTATMYTVDDNILPKVPNDESWLKALCAGGVMKVDESTVIAAIRAALASQVGLYSVPEKLAKKIEDYADTNEDPVPTEFFKIRKQLTKRSYAEIFDAIDGMDGNFVSEARKKAFLGKINSNLWPAITDFYSQLKNWAETWQQGAANPAMMMSAMAMMMNGGGKMPGMMAPPETGALRDEADALNNSINKVFSGVGVQISAALAYEASKIKESLENPKIPALMGVANRDQMLKMLSADVPATYARLETNITRFVLGVIKIKDVSVGEEEQQYFSSLYMLGSQIPWDKLSSGIKGSLGGGKI